MTNTLSARRSVLDAPAEPDWARMRTEVGARLRSAMAEHGVDALILLMNGYVGYATGASWPLLDAGLSHVERPVAVVLADDEHPHLFMPLRSGSSAESPVPNDHLHGPAYLEFDHGVQEFARQLADLIPPERASPSTSSPEQCDGQHPSSFPVARRRMPRSCSAPRNW